MPFCYTNILTKVIIYHFLLFVTGWYKRGRIINGKWEEIDRRKKKARKPAKRKELSVFLLLFLLHLLYVCFWRVLIAAEVRLLSSKGLCLMQVRVCVRACVCDCSACPWLAAGKQRFRPPQLPHHYCSQGSPATHSYTHTRRHTQWERLSHSYAGTDTKTDSRRHTQRHSPLPAGSSLSQCRRQRERTTVPLGSLSSSPDRET